MAEFKVNAYLSAEITSLETSGEGINAEAAQVSSDGVSTLKAGTRFVQEHSSIMKLLDLYQSLVAKEASDLQTMLKSAQAMDIDLSNSMK